MHNINETFQSDFDFQAYKPMIISPHYIIQSNKLFYLWKDDPYPNGLY